APPQGGYCPPGCLLTAAALLRDKPAATRQEIAEATAGNLCRCTGYLKIFEAIELAAARMRGETAPDAEALAKAAEVVRGLRRRLPGQELAARGRGAGHPSAA